MCVLVPISSRGTTPRALTGSLLPVGVLHVISVEDHSVAFARFAIFLVTIVAFSLQTVHSTKATTTTSILPLGVCSISPRIRQLGHALREIDVDTMIINQHALHLEVSLLTILLVLELDECILKTITGTLVPDYLA